MPNQKPLMINKATSNGVKKIKVLITGANGFIGKNIFEAFSGRDDLELVGTFHDKEPKIAESRLVRANLMDKDEAIRVSKDADIVIHAAAISAGAKYIVENPGFLLDNTIINTNILEAAHVNGVKRFIFLSCSVLYPMDLGRPVAEDDFDIARIHPKYHAGAWVKIYAEKLCEFYAKLGRVGFTVVRHSNIYGPNDKFDLDRSHVLGATITKVMQAPDGAEIVIWGDGQGHRDFLHISDLIKFIEMIMNVNWQFEIFNIGMGKAFSVNELTDKVISTSGKNLKVRHDVSKPSIGGVNLAMDISKAKEAVGWSPAVNLEEGINMTLDWYKSNV